MDFNNFFGAIATNGSEIAARLGGYELAKVYAKNEAELAKKYSIDHALQKREQIAENDDSHLQNPMFNTKNLLIGGAVIVGLVVLLKVL